MNMQNAAKNKTLEVSAIEQGTVIDHLPNEKVLQILKLLKPSEEHMITIGINLKSKSTGTKGIIKLSNKILDEKERNIIAILAPNATLNVIKDYQVVEKKLIELRGIEPNIITCNNPNCITNHEKMTTKFSIKIKTPLEIRCGYCERSILEEEIILKE